MGFLSSIVSGIGDVVTGNWGGLVGDVAGLIGGIPDSAISSAVGAYAGYQGTADTNNANLDIARENNAFNAAQAGINRDFQLQSQQRVMDYNTDMSNTSYQRGVKDMEAAGLNPMLAYSQGGASTPTTNALSGSSATSSGNPVMQNKALAAVQGATSAANIHLQEAQAGKLEAETKTELNRPENVVADTRYKVSSAGKNAAEVERLLAERDVLRYRLANNLPAEADFSATGATRNVAETGRINAMLPVQVRLNTVEARLKELGVSEAKAYSDFYSTSVGRAAPYLDAGGKFIGSAAGAVRDLAIGSGRLGLRPPRGVRR